jgi:hypothetical protein
MRLVREDDSVEELWAGGRIGSNGLAKVESMRFPNALPDEKTGFIAPDPDENPEFAPPPTMDESILRRSDPEAPGNAGNEEGAPAGAPARAVDVEGLPQADLVLSVNEPEGAASEEGVPAGFDSEDGDVPDKAGKDPASPPNAGENVSPGAERVARLSDAFSGSTAGVVVVRASLSRWKISRVAFDRRSFSCSNRGLEKASLRSTVPSVPAAPGEAALDARPGAGREEESVPYGAS